jgi:hypothetical protein
MSTPPGKEDIKLQKPELPANLISESSFSFQDILLAG